MNGKRALISAIILFFAASALTACQSSPRAGSQVPPIYGSLSRNASAENTVTLWATGKGVPPNYVSSDAQALVMAERAAIADAYRLLAEKISGAFVSSRQQVDNMALDYDRIKMGTNTWLRGAEIVSVKHTPDYIVEALVKVTIPADAPLPATVTTTTGSNNPNKP